MKQSTKNIETISIRNIFAKNNIILSEKGKLKSIQEPIWKDKINKHGIAAFDISKQIPAELEIELSAIPSRYSKYILEGVLNEKILFSGIINKSENIIVTCQFNPGTFAFIENENIVWQFNSTNSTPLKIGSTHFDLFWVDLGLVKENLIRKGTALELLQNQKKCIVKSQLFDSEIGPLVNNVPAIVQSVFTNVPPRYDIWRGAYHFITINSWNNITLHYNAYLNAHNNLLSSTLNCYDAAAILQHYLQYNRYASSFCYMNPFGYLRQSNLIGRGQCNNPFYGGAQGPPAITGGPLINKQDYNRTAFGNHAFLHLTSNSAIVDACAGPHTGTEYAAAYVANATDNVYPNPPRVPRGTTANIAYYTGVTHVNLISSIKSMFKTPHIKALKKIIDFKSNDIKNNTNKIISGTWMNPMEYKGINPKWANVYEEIVPGKEEVLKIVILKNNDKMIMLKLYISSAGNHLALNRFLSIASLSQHSDLPFENFPESSGHYSVVDSNARCTHFVGVYHNAVLNIQSTDDNMDVIGLADWYFNWAKKQLKSDVPKELPKSVLSATQSRDGLLKVAYTSKDNLILEHIGNAKSARLIAEEKGILTFDKVKKRIKKLSFSLIDSKNLLVKPIDFALNKIKTI